MEILIIITATIAGAIFSVLTDWLVKTEMVQSRRIRPLIILFSALLTLLFVISVIITPQALPESLSNFSIPDVLRDVVAHSIIGILLLGGGIVIYYFASKRIARQHESRKLLIQMLEQKDKLLFESIKTDVDELLAERSA